MKLFLKIATAAVLSGFPVALSAQEWRLVPLASQVQTVAPMTGLVVWTDTQGAESDAVQLEFSYLLYNDVVDGTGRYDWSSVDALLDRIAARGHQAILRFRWIYPGFDQTAVPDVIKQLPDYRETVAESEGQPTAFCDWSHPALQTFALDFHSAFAERYDRDVRLAFVQTGFGLWAEYHIYDGPMELGRTFPSKAYQARFLKHLDRVYALTPWSLSIDAAAAERTPFATQTDLLGLGFGLFDDSFMHAKHGDYNTTCWNFFGRDRWQTAPAGGEFSYYTPHDQAQALAPDGPHGESFAAAAARFHITYMLGNDQPRHRSDDDIRRAGLSLGYRFRVDALTTDGTRSRATITNVGVAPIYHDAYPALGDVRSDKTLKGLLPGESDVFEIRAMGDAEIFSIASDRLVESQVIPFETANPPSESK